jgi:hypothetical protein
MLRYDACYPYSTSDACSMERPRAGSSLPDDRSITLVSEREPTPDRWASFGWGCGAPERM